MSEPRGRFLFRAGLTASWRTSRADAEGVGLALPGGKLLDSRSASPRARASASPGHASSTISRAAGRRPDRRVPRPGRRGCSGSGGRLCPGRRRRTGRFFLATRHSPLFRAARHSHDRISWRRSAQAALEMSQGGRPVLPLDGDRALVEEHERVVGPSMTEDHRPEPGIDHGVSEVRRSDKPESPVLRSPTSCDISDAASCLLVRRRGVGLRGQNKPSAISDSRSVRASSQLICRTRIVVRPIAVRPVSMGPT
jgi:hypothetical protein